MTETPGTAANATVSNAHATMLARGVIGFVFRWHRSDTDSPVFRVLRVDRDADMLALIDVNPANKTASLEWLPRVSVLTALNNGQAYPADDPWATFETEDNISPARKGIRNRAWQRIQPLVEGLGPDIFDEKKRNGMIAALEARALLEGLPFRRATITDTLRRYWQGGGRQGLLAQYNRCGAPGKPKYVNPDKPGKKRGRRRNSSGTDDLNPGIVVTAGVRKKFAVGIKKHYHTKHKNPLHEAYTRTLHSEFYARHDLDKDGKTVIPKLPPDDELPTMRQFEHWYHTTRDLIKELEAREGQRAFNLRHRAVRGNATRLAHAPTWLYQIDATIADVYLVSRIDRRIIGRPVVYVVTDTFSHLIVGVYIGLEWASWEAAMQALENAMADKMTLFKDFGLDDEFGPDAWPSSGLLPQYLLADRAELLSGNAHNMIAGLDIAVHNTAPWRPDWKPIVERDFRTLNDMTQWLPGHVIKRARGEQDCRLNAAIDLYTFTRIIIRNIVHHNKYHEIKNYPVSKEMAEHQTTQGLTMAPIDLWNWGLDNINGEYRTKDPAVIRANLLRPITVSITARGIEHQGLVYHTERADAAQWYVRARREGVRRQEACMDWRKPGEIYLRLDRGRTLLSCALDGPSREFDNLDFHEIRHHFESLKRLRTSNDVRTERNQATAELYARNQQDVAEDTAKTDGARGDESARSLVVSIRENRAHEKAILDAEAAALAPSLAEATGEGQVPGEVDIADAAPTSTGSTAPTSSALADRLRQRQTQRKANAG